MEQLTERVLTAPVGSALNQNHCAEEIPPYGPSLATVSPALSSFPLRPLALAEVPKYLESREAVAHPSAELPLFMALDDKLRGEVEASLGKRPGRGAFDKIKALVTGGKSVVKAVLTARQELSPFSPLRLISATTLREKYDRYVDSKDWLVLVNRAKAGPAWQERDATGLPDAFLEFVASRIGTRKGRRDTTRQAILSVKRQWRTGRNDKGEAQIIPGYEKIPVTLSLRPLRPLREVPFSDRNPEIEPLGWHETNIRRQLEARAVLNKAVKALLQEGTAAARPHLPCVHGTRSLLKFMERVQFDDVKTDFRVLDVETGQVCDLWLLIARDVATNILLGFGMRPALAREDGSQEHLKLKDMKQLLGWLLEHFGLPPYLMHWVFERGTASIGQALARALYELLGEDRIRCHWTGMIGGKSPTGYAERKVGNAAAKGSLESCNRLLHTMAAHLPGQVGPLYTRRPSDVQAREKETIESWKLAQYLPEHLRGRMEYPILDLSQARRELTRIFLLQNERTTHELESFETVIDAYNPRLGKRIPVNQCDPSDAVSDFKRRKESPFERCHRLVKTYLAQHPNARWTSVAPHIITTFYEHSVREVKIDQNGVILLKLDGNKVTYVNPGAKVAAGSALAYAHPEDPRFLHVTTGKGAILGTWLRRSLATDQASLAEALRYTNSALNAARAQAEKLAAPDRAALEAMRAHNAQLLESHTFVPLAIPHSALRTPHSASASASPIAAALASVPRTRKRNLNQIADDQLAADSFDTL